MSIFLLAYLPRFSVWDTCKIINQLYIHFPLTTNIIVFWKKNSSGACNQIMIPVFCLECEPGYIGPNCKYVCPYPMYGNYCISECHCSEENCRPDYGCLSIFIFSTPVFVSLLLSKYILKKACGFLICRRDRCCHKAFTEISNFTLNNLVAHNECKWLDLFSL